MKRIGIINSIYPYGSTGRICLEMQKSLQDRGFDVVCFHGEGAETSPANYNFSFKFSKCVNAFLSRLDDRAGFHSKIETKRLLNKLDEFSPNLLIVHNMHAYYLDLELFLNYVSNKKIPVIFVLHDCWNFTGHCSYFDYIQCKKWMNQCGECPQTKSYPKSFLCDKSMENYNEKKMLFSKIENKVFVTPSFWLESLVRESFLKNNPIVTIHNGIDLNVFKKQSTDKRSDKKIILCVANAWDERKGLNDVVTLSHLVQDEYEIKIVGRLKNRVKLPPNIVHISHTNNALELARLYSSADVFFNPTYEDNYPTVNLEALACECPVVCYRTGGATEMLDSKYTVEKGDLKNALEIIKQITEDGLYHFPDRLLFDKKLQYEKYLEIIEKML